MAEREILIIKLAAVYRSAACPVMIGKITTLNHEVRDYPVKRTALEPKSLLACTQSTEILSCSWNNICL